MTSLSAQAITPYINIAIILVAILTMILARKVNQKSILVQNGIKMTGLFSSLAIIFGIIGVWFFIAKETASPSMLVMVASRWRGFLQALVILIYMIGKLYTILNALYHSTKRGR